MQPSSQANAFLAEREVAEDYKEFIDEDSYLPPGMRGPRFLQGRGAARNRPTGRHDQSPLTAEQRRGTADLLDRSRTTRPQTAHTTLGEDCSHLWQEVGEYAHSQRRLQVQPNRSISTPTLSQTPGGAPSSSASHFPNANPSATSEPRRRPVSVYIARSARSGVEETRVHSTSGSSLARAAPVQGRETFSDPAMTHARESRFTSETSDRSRTTLTASHAIPLDSVRPQSAGIVHTNPTYRLPLRPSTAIRRPESRQLSWNDYSEHEELSTLPEAHHSEFHRKPASNIKLPGRGASPQPDGSGGWHGGRNRPHQERSRPSSSSSSWRGTTASRPVSAQSNRSFDAVLASTALLTLPLFSIPGSTVNSPLPDPHLLDADRRGTTTALGGRQGFEEVQETTNPSPAPELSTDSKRPPSPPNNAWRDSSASRVQVEGFRAVPVQVPAWQSGHRDATVVARPQSARRDAMGRLPGPAGGWRREADVCAPGEEGMHWGPEDAMSGMPREGNGAHSRWAERGGGGGAGGGGGGAGRRGSSVERPPLEYDDLRGESSGAERRRGRLQMQVSRAVAAGGGKAPVAGAEPRARRRRRMGKSALLQKVDLHVRRKKVLKVRQDAVVRGRAEEGRVEALLQRTLEESPTDGVRRERDGAGDEHHGGIPMFVRESSDELISLCLTIVCACDLGNTKMWGMNDPYATIEVEGRMKRTRIVTSTVNPHWNEEFIFQIRNLRSNVTVKIRDKHADHDFNLLGVAEFRILDVMLRSGWPRDSDSFSGTTWFVLQNQSGLPTVSTVQLQLRLEGCRNWKQEPEEKVPRFEDVSAALMSMPTDFDEDSATQQGRRHAMYKKHAQHAAEEPDLGAMFQGQKPLEEGIDEGYYSRRSLRLFTCKNRFRQWVFALVTSWLFGLLSWSMALAACIAIGAQPQPVNPAATVWGAIELVSYSFLSIEIVLKSVAFGFMDKASSFLFGSAFNGIDLLVAISYWVELFLPPPYNKELTFRPFRLFRLLIPLTYFKIFMGLTSIFVTLKRAALSLTTVISLTILFYVGFGIFAVTFYHDSFSRRCVSAVTGEVMLPERWCKAFSDDGGSSCFAGQECVVVGNPDGVNFDHMGRALTSIFLAVGLDGLQDIMNISIESEPQFRMLGVAFFICLIFLCRLLLFNLCVAVVTTTFHRVRKDVANALKAFRVHSSMAAVGSHLKKELSRPSFESTFQTSKTFQSTTTTLEDASPLAPPHRTKHTRERPGSPSGLAQLTFRDIVVSMVSHPLFAAVAMSTVAVNLCSMALQHAGVSEERTRLLQSIQLCTEVLFVVELCLRMMGSHSLPEFFSRGYDKFDFLVCLLIAMHLFAQMFGVPRARLGMLPSFSALRFIRLVGCIPEINHLLKLSLASITNIVNLLFFTFSFMSVMSLCAMFLFRAHAEYGDPAAEDFSSYWVSMNTLFQVLTGDMWRFVLFRSMRHGYDTDNAWRSTVPALFLMAFFFAAQAILLNLYIAVIVENFNQANMKRGDSDIAGDQGPRRLRRSVFRRLADKAKQAYRVMLPPLPKRLRSWTEETDGLGSRVPSTHRETLKRKASLTVDYPTGMMTSPARPNPGRRMHSINKQPARKNLATLGSLPSETDSLGSNQSHNQGLALGMFEPEHPLRLLCHEVAESSWFKLLILATIAVSMVALALEPPARDSEPPVPYYMLDRINLASTIVFCFEFIVQVTKDGFIFGKGAYMHNLWNVSDFLVLVLSILDLAGGNTKEFRVLRLGRALRPLRLIKRNQGMRLMVTAITSTWRPVLMIVVLATTVATIFALMGMALFKNRFWTCSDSGIRFPEGKIECSGTAQGHHGVLSPRAWVLPEQNFDTFGKAMAQCLAMNTFKWVDVMRLATAATEEGKSPLEDYSWSHSLFFIVYEIVGSLFVMNLFVAFIIDGFKQLRKAEFKHLQVLAQYDAYMKLVFKLSPHRTHPLPTGSPRVWVRTQVVQTFAFSVFSQSCMYLNVIFMAAYSPTTASEEFTSFYLWQNDVFLGLLVLEVCMYVFAFGVRNFLRDPWEWIDMASIAASCVAFLFPQSGFVRSFRLIKVLRMIKNFLSVVFLLVIISTMFAVLLVNIAGLTREGFLRLGSPVARWPHIQPNFQSYPVAMYTLFHITQGEDWHLLVYDTAVSPPACTERFSGRDYGDCGQPLWLTMPIFLGYKLLAEYVLLNLLIGMIIDTFSTTSSHVSVQFRFEPARSDYASQRHARMKQRGALNAGIVSRAPMSPNRKRSITGGKETERGRKYLLESSSCMDCWRKVTGGGRHDFILIEDVQLLLRILPQPLGFSRNAFGEPEMAHRDRSACKLILAELNLIALDRRYEEAGQSACTGTTAWMSRMVGLRPPIPWKTSQVTFEETFATLLYWRCPHLVPPEVKKARLPLQDDIVRTAHAMIIRRLIRRWLSAHRDHKQSQSLPQTRRLSASTPKAITGPPPPHATAPTPNDAHGGGEVKLLQGAGDLAVGGVPVSAASDLQDATRPGPKQGKAWTQAERKASLREDNGSGVHSGGAKQIGELSRAATPTGGPGPAAWTVTAEHQPAGAAALSAGAPWPLHAAGSARRGLHLSDFAEARGVNEQQQTTDAAEAAGVWLGGGGTPTDSDGDEGGQAPRANPERIVGAEGRASRGFSSSEFPRGAGHRWTFGDGSSMR